MSGSPALEGRMSNNSTHSAFGPPGPSRGSVLNPSDKLCSYASTHARIELQRYKSRAERIKARERTNVDGLLLRLHSNPALLRNLHGEDNGLAYDDTPALTNDATGYVLLGSFTHTPYVPQACALSRTTCLLPPRLRHEPASSSWPRL